MALILRPHARPPSIPDRVNTVVKLWHNPCDAPWTVYAESAAKASLKAVVFLACFDVTDIARAMFRPDRPGRGPHARGGRRGGGKEGKSRKRKRGLGNIFTIGEDIGEFLGEATGLHQRQVSDGVHHMWEIDAAIQKVAWAWLIFDAAVDFAYNWTTMIYRSEQCQMALSPGRGKFHVDTWISANNNIPLPFGAPSPDYLTGSLGYLNGEFFFPEGTWNIAASARGRPVSAKSTAWVQLYGSGMSPTGWLTESAPQTAEPGEEMQFALAATVTGPGSANFAIVSDHHIVGDFANCMVMGAPPSIPEPTQRPCYGINP